MDEVGPFSDQVRSSFKWAFIRKLSERNVSVEEQSGKYKERRLGTEVVCIMTVNHFIYLHTKLLAYYRKKPKNFRHEIFTERKAINIIIIVRNTFRYVRWGSRWHSG